MADILKSLKRLAISAGRGLPAGLRRSLFHFAFDCDRAEFEKFAFLYANAPNQQVLLRRVTAAGFSPRGIVDVGAYQGDWSRMARSIWPNATLIMVEPNREQTAQLHGVASDINATLRVELLGPTDGTEVQFHVMATGSSVLPERSNVARKTEVRRLTTLNSLLAGDTNIDFLKIDAQGYELSILDGADKLLPNLQAVLLETALIEVNEGSPILDDVVTYMRARDFVAFDILEMHRRPLDKALAQIDIFFVRKNASLRTDKRFM